MAQPSRKRMLWVGRDRSREQVRPFFELLGKEGCQRTQAVAMDMNSALVANYGGEVIDRVRVDGANRLRYSKAARRMVKASH